MPKSKKTAPETSDPSHTGQVVIQELSEQIQTNYLDYAMSVIVSRALPDVRDGLKPVARRILYSMWLQGLRSTAKFRKSAYIVGDVLGKYHPHSDTAVYDAIARLAQDFSLRYTMINGQGNWGSIDGDAPAAMRYTEAKLAKIADEMLLTIEKNTVNYVDNYDSTRKEPVVLPSTAPNFLINGAIGIAVGMATKVPPHNLTEVCNAAVHLIDHPDATVEDLMKYVQGPDFPTGGVIYNRSEIRQAYATGRGRVVTRAVANIEEGRSGAFRIIVSEIPYLVNKSALITKIAEAVKNKRLEGIKDLRDESDKQGIRVVIELKKDAFPKKVLNRLYAITDLQQTFHVNMLALVDSGKQPKVLSLKEALEEHITHRREVVTRRTQYDLDRAKDRAHILVGLKIALDHINEVINTIRKSRTKEIAHTNLRKNYQLSPAQATAILEMRLQTLAGLERQKIEDELKAQKKLIKELTDILKNPQKISAIIKGEYQALISTYGDARRTRVLVRAVSEFSQEDLIPNEPTIISITRGGYIKRLATSTYRVQLRGGKGVRGMATKQEDIVDMLLATTTHKQLLFFTNRGRVFSTPAYEIPVTTRTAKGQALPNFLELAANEHVTAVEAIAPNQPDDDAFLIMATTSGQVKKTARRDFANIRRSGLIAINLKAEDALEWVGLSTGEDEVLLVSEQGQAIRFKEKDVRPMGRAAAGVKGMKLKGQDKVVAMHVITSNTDQSKQVMVITANGYGKRTPLKQYRVTGRGGTGIKTATITAKTGPIVNANVIDSATLDTTDVLIISEKGQVIRVSASSINQMGRATQGVKVMKPSEQSGQVATFTTWTKN